MQNKKCVYYYLASVKNVYKEYIQRDMVAYRRKRKTTRRKPAARKMTIPRPMRNRGITYITRCADFIPFQIGPAADAWSTTGYTFRLADLPSFTDFTNLFDSYKITGVKLTWFPRYFGGDTVGGATAGNPASGTPHIWVLTDDDSDNPLTSKLAALQCDKARMIRNPWRPFSVFVRPKFTAEVRVSAGIAGAVPQTGWCHTQNSGVIHYGISIGGDVPGYAAGATFNPLVWDCYAKYYLQFKEPM